jgi:hypothetical protein
MPNPSVNGVTRPILAVYLSVVKDLPKNSAKILQKTIEIIKFTKKAKYLQHLNTFLARKLSPARG